jgi:hypothetical protein
MTDLSTHLAVLRLSLWRVLLLQLILLNSLTPHLTYRTVVYCRLRCFDTMCTRTAIGVKMRKYDLIANAILMRIHGDTQCL